MAKFEALFAVDIPFLGRTILARKIQSVLIAQSNKFVEEKIVGSVSLSYLEA